MTQQQKKLPINGQLRRPAVREAIRPRAEGNLHPFSGKIPARLENWAQAEREIRQDIRPVSFAVRPIVGRVKGNQYDG